ncbi:MAG: YezD family protein [Deltaproteobacteria bacterium]|nr:YezD family protein [Deltaproteobacteria bacterium]
MPNTTDSFSKQNNSPTHKSFSSDTWIKLAQEFADRIRFGSIEITVHEGKVVQIDKKEKFRFS